MKALSACADAQIIDLRSCWVARGKCFALDLLGWAKSQVSNNEADLCPLITNGKDAAAIKDNSGLLRRMTMMKGG